MPRPFRRLPFLAGVVLLTLSLGLISTTPAFAKRTEIRAVTDLVPQFEPGLLQRTSIAPQKDANSPANDGRLELAPIGYISTWEQSSFDLPERLINHAAVELNGAIYIIGGDSYNAIDNSRAPTDHVWRSTPASNGDLSGTWQQLPNGLPAVPTPVVSCAQTDTPLPGRSSVAAASLSTGDKTGFIYVAGGTLASSTVGEDLLPTSAVAIGQVAADGTVTWKNGPCLPRLVEAASATIINVQGTNYLYVVGGLERTFEGNRFISVGVRDTYLARINPSTGDLTTVGGQAGWDTNGSLLPGLADTQGVWDGTLVSYASQTPSGTQSAIYLMGGQTTPGATNNSAIVYRGLIDPSSGQVGWNVDVGGTGPFAATLNSARRGVRAVVYNGNVMAIGGVQGSSDPLKDVLSNQFDDNLNLPIFNGNVNFYPSENVLLKGRADHAAVVVPVGTDHYVYVLGGQGEQTENGGLPTNTTFFGKIATDPNQNVGYALAGRYFSAPFQITDLVNARLLSVRWTTALAAGTDIKLEFRTSNDPAKPESSFTDWVPAVDPGAGGAQSKNGVNSYPLPQGVGLIYFEYRVLLTTTQPSGGQWQTPALNEVSIEVEVPGYPNLQVASVATQQKNGFTSGLNVQIANRNALPVGTPLLSAEEGSKGSFFVDVFITKGASAAAPTFGQLGQVYAEVDKSAMTPNASFNIQTWCETATFNCAYDVTKQFPESGTYTIYAIVDNVDNKGSADAQTKACPSPFAANTDGQPCGNVQEADNPGQDGEADNIFGPTTINVTLCTSGCTPSFKVLMPIMTRP